MTTFLYAVLQRTSFANVIMIMLIIGGLLSFMFIRQELFPTMQSRQVEIMVGLPGASPEEVDRSVIMTIENTLRGMDGIKRIDAEAREGTGVVTATLLESAEPQQVLADIKSGVDRIENLPADAEKPIITIPAHVEKALSVIVYGDQPLLWLRQAAETMRDDLRTGLGTGVGLQQVQLAFAPDGEISVEIAEDTLRHYGITLEEVALEIRKSAPDLPGGTLYTGESEIVLRTSKQREWAADLSDVIVAQTAAGFPLYLKDIASLKDGNGRSSIECWFNGLPALQIDIYVTANETPREVEKIVRDYLESVASEKFQGVETVIFENQAAAYQSRMALLVENALLGLLLVLIILGLFLTPQMAFWVMVSIPTTLLGGLLLLPLFGGTINMISMFAFIVTIGVVVDDAIMIGEAIHTHRARGLTMLAAAVQGVQEMGGLVFLATLTTIIAFMPMFFVPGDMGVLFYQIPAVVVAVLVVSLLESLFILAAHVSVDHPENRLLKILARPQYWVNRRLNSFIELWFRPFLLRCLKCQPSLFGTAILIVLLTVGGVAGGLLNFSFTPTIAADMVIAQAALPYGSPRNESITVMKRLVDAAEEVLEKNGMSSKGIFSLIGTRLEEGEVEVETLAGTHYISVLMALPPEEGRTVSGRQFAHLWQEAFGSSGGLEALNFTGETNITGGEPIMLEVFHPDPEVARAAALSLGERMRLLAGLTSVDDGVRAGKPELTVSVNDRGLLMGMTAEEIALQIRHRFHGMEAYSFIRDNNEIKVMVRLSENQRQRINALDRVLLRSPSGAFIPLAEVAEITQGRSFTSVARRDGRRIYPVTADIGFGIKGDVVEDILEDALVPKIVADYPGVSIHFGGEEEENDEALASLGFGFLAVLGGMYLLLVYHFNSAVQPLVVLLTVPFSMVGAVWGHILLGYDLSIVSVIGIIAMAGVVVNDSLVLVTTCNRYCKKGESLVQAVLDSACDRFRPILLTSLTTFFGLTPLLLETSEQAQFLIPAAISISFGLLSGTVVALLLVPGFLVILHSRRSAGTTAPAVVRAVDGEGLSRLV